jgi:hypothetical protein
MSRPYSGETPWRRVRRVIVVPKPAASADWSMTVPGGVVWSVKAIVATLATSATVANRAAAISMTDGTTEFYRGAAGAVQAASKTFRYSWSPTESPSATGSVVNADIPDVVLPSGYAIGSSTELIDTTDQWSAIALCVVETVVQDGAVDLGDIPDMTVEVVLS